PQPGESAAVSAVAGDASGDVQRNSRVKRRSHLRSQTAWPRYFRSLRTTRRGNTNGWLAVKLACCIEATLNTLTVSDDNMRFITKPVLIAALLLIPTNFLGAAPQS